jgi:hypothetical protein
MDKEMSNKTEQNPDAVSNLIHHARREFLALGYIPLHQEQEDGPNKWIQQNIMDLLELFSKQGHSGMSAPYCVNLFQKLAMYQPLCPLTGSDDEWNDIGGQTKQNNRCSSVFKEGIAPAYDIDAVQYKGPNGSVYSGGHGRCWIEFPYTPHVETVLVDWNGETIEPDEWKRLQAEFQAKANADAEHGEEK